MAGWLAVMGALPWGDIVKATPALMEKATAAFDRISENYKELQARKLLTGGKPPSIDQRVQILEGDLGALNSEMKSVGQLIVDMSLQNQGLVRRVQRNMILLYASLGLNVVVLTMLAIDLFP
jgi:hypothetical protein